MIMTSVPPPDVLPSGALAWTISDPDSSYPITSAGPWTGEPDKAQWVDPATGLDCLIVRNKMGSLCGYVGVPNDHYAYGMVYDDVPVQVHGGLTYAGLCRSGPAWVEATDCPIAHPYGEEGWRPSLDGHEHMVQPDENVPSPGICHVPFPGRPHDVYWLGFDCGHAWDIQPGLMDWEASLGLDSLPTRDFLEMGSHYRDLAYVVGEVRSLAAQLASVSA